MSCEEVNRDEVVEQYLLGQLGDEARDAFEQHYFECARCFQLLQSYQDLQVELARSKDAIVSTPARRWIRKWAWLPAAAVVFLALRVFLSERPGTGIGGSPPVAAPAPAPLASSASQGSSPQPAAPFLEDLARVEAPRYAQDRLRGAADPATVRFQQAMDRYQQRDYAGAIAPLREASRVDPEAPHIAFFLGVSNLLAGRPGEAADALRATVALGESPYLEEAHFYLAKAYVRRGRIDEAITEVERTIRLRGELEAQARVFLGQLQAFKAVPR